MLSHLIEIAVFASAVFLSPASQLAGEYDVPLRLARHIEQGAACADLDLDIVFAVVYVESRFRPDAVGHAGEVGLMQVKPSTASVYGFTKEDLYDPINNVCAGSRYLHRMLRKYGDMRLALVAYNAGPGNLNRMLASDRVNYLYPSRVLGD